MDARRQLDRAGWDVVMKTYRESFEKQFGDYRLEDFSFGFTGDANRGIVSIVHKGTALPGLRVVSEQNRWALDER